jgi:hypothetical protein
MFGFVHAEGDFFPFLDHRAPYVTSMVPCLRFASTRPRLGRYAYTSIGGYTYPGSPPTRVLAVPDKWI